MNREVLEAIGIMVAYGVGIASFIAIGCRLSDWFWGE